LKRRQAVEPAMGHLNSDRRMERSWLPCATGDETHALLQAAAYNLRWLLRAILRRGIKPLFLCLWAWWCQWWDIAHRGQTLWGAIRASAWQSLHAISKPLDRTENVVE